MKETIMKVTVRELVQAFAKEPMDDEFFTTLFDAMDDDLMMLLAKILNRDTYLRDGAKNHARHVGTLAWLMAAMIAQTNEGEHEVACALSGRIANFFHASVHVQLAMREAEKNGGTVKVPDMPDDPTTKCAPPGTPIH